MFHLRVLVTETALPEQPSDNESFVEDSSGTEDSSTVNTRSETDPGLLRKRVSMAASSARRYMISTERKIPVRKSYQN